MLAIPASARSTSRKLRLFCTVPVLTEAATDDAVYARKYGGWRADGDDPDRRHRRRRHHDLANCGGRARPGHLSCATMTATRRSGSRLGGDETTTLDLQNSHSRLESARVCRARSADQRRSSNGDMTFQTIRRSRRHLYIARWQAHLRLERLRLGHEGEDAQRRCGRISATIGPDLRRKLAAPDLDDRTSPATCYTAITDVVAVNPDRSIRTDPADHLRQRNRADVLRFRPARSLSIPSLYLFTQNDALRASRAENLWANH